MNYKQELFTMGPYCKFCNTRCFKPTTKDSLIKTDLEATCLEGIIHDMNKTYPKLFNTSGRQVGWLLSLDRHSEDKCSLAAELINGKIYEFQIKNTDLEEILDLCASPGDNLYYRCK